MRRWIVVVEHARFGIRIYDISSESSLVLKWMEGREDGKRVNLPLELGRWARMTGGVLVYWLNKEGAWPTVGRFDVTVHEIASTTERRR